MSLCQVMLERMTTKFDESNTLSDNAHTALMLRKVIRQKCNHHHRLGTPYKNQGILVVVMKNPCIFTRV